MRLLSRQLVLAPLAEEVEIVSVVEDADRRSLLNKVNVLARNVRAVQVDKVDIRSVLLNPIPDSLLHGLAVEHLNAELGQRRGVGFLRCEVVAEEFDLIALLHKHL